MSPLRAPSDVMRLARLGASHQTRLSFMRVLLRKIRQHGWTTDRPVWCIDDQGVGHAVYRIRGSGQTYSLVAFAHELDADQRTDRVIAEAWDATFALVDGEVTVADIERLGANVPLQEAGRVSGRELVLSRANKSVRNWDYVMRRLAAGQQPEAHMIAECGYLMRTTAVYGSGKFGAADFLTLRDRPVVGGPFRIEMLAVWLIRAFVMDLVEHVARSVGGSSAVPLDPSVRRLFGIGNSTGLGMAPYLVNHPTLLNAWITARETALARVRALPMADHGTRTAFRTGLDAMRRLADTWQTDHPYQARKVAGLQADLTLLDQHTRGPVLDGARPWDRLFHWGEQHLSMEGQEALASLLIEPHGALVDDLADTMAVDEEDSFRIDGQQSTEALSRHVDGAYGWALGYAGTKADTARFWYTSVAKLEPRLGERHSEPGSERELPLATARAVVDMVGDLRRTKAVTVAAFVAEYPEHRHTVRRVQRNMAAPYSEIQDNLTAAEMMPIDMLRCKLAFFGATRFDPRSDRWLRITMFQGAPFPGESATAFDEGWIFADRVA